MSRHHFAVRYYKLLLLLLPKQFRARFGSDMVRLFEDRLTDAGTLCGRCKVLVRATADLFDSARAEALSRTHVGRSRQILTQRVCHTSSFSRDLRYGIRNLKKNPAHAIVSMLTVGLGIGATTVAFSLVNGILFRPLPFPNPHELMFLLEQGANGRQLMLSYPNFDDWRQHSRSFSDISAVQFPSEVAVLGGIEAVRATVLNVSREFFRVLDVAPILGRPILPTENRSGGNRVVVVSYEFWSRTLGANRDLETLSVRLYGGPWQVVGVLPPGFRVLEYADIYVPMELDPVPIRSAHNYRGVGRLNDGVTIFQAREEMDRIAANIKAAYGQESDAEAVAIRPLREEVVGEANVPLLLLLAASGALLLIACTNQAGTLLARGAQRHREMAIRSAIGAARLRLVRQLLTESGLLGGLGCLTGVALTFGTIEGIKTLGPDLVPRLETVAVDSGALIFALLVSLFTSLLFGLYPALETSKSHGKGLRDGAQRGGTGGRARAWDLLVGTEVAMAVLLVAASGLLVRSLAEIVATDAGFTTAGIVTVDLDLSGLGHRTGAERSALLLDLKSDIAEITGVSSVGFVNRLPTESGTWTGPVLRSPVSDRENRDEWAAIAGWRVVDEDYFKTMGIALLAGRGFSAAKDRADAPTAVILNAALAERVFPGDDPIGKQVQALWDRRAEDMTVVGLVGEARDWRRAPGNQPEIYVYWPQRMEATGFMTAVIGSGVGRSIAGQAVSTAIRAVAPALPLEIRSMEDRIGDSLTERKFTLSVLGSFAVAAVVLSMVGVYGVVSYTISRRTREIGIRLALGAGPETLRRTMFGAAIRVVAVGAAVGTAGALGAGHLIRGLLFGVGPRDPVALSVAPVFLVLTAAMAVWIPVLRSTRIDPRAAMHLE